MTPDASSGPPDPISPLVEAAAQLYELYLAFVAAGFEGQHALYLTGLAMSNAQRGTPPETTGQAVVTLVRDGAFDVVEVDIPGLHRCTCTRCGQESIELTTRQLPQWVDAHECGLVRLVG